MNFQVVSEEHRENDRGWLTCKACCQQPLITASEVPTRLRSALAYASLEGTKNDVVVLFSPELTDPLSKQGILIRHCATFADRFDPDGAERLVLHSTQV